MVSKRAPVNTESADFGTFEGRLIAERDRLGLKQVDLCARIRVSKTTQIQYEQGRRRPDVSYLVYLEKLGFDLMYLLTGERSSTALSAEHQNLIDAQGNTRQGVIGSARENPALAHYGATRLAAQLLWFDRRPVKP